MWRIDFICPHCKQSSYIIEEEACPVSNDLLSFDLCSYIEDEHGGIKEATDVEGDWGPREVHEPDISRPYWLCGECWETIDENIKTLVDLFNWLYKRGMVTEND